MSPALQLVNADVRGLADAIITATKSSPVFVSGNFARAMDLKVEANPPLEAKVIDCQGLPLTYGFVDAHCHVMAYASSLTAVDCRPSAVSSITALKEAIRSRVSGTPEGHWVRATGYSDFDLSEKRHPTRTDLDEVAPHHPVRLNHRSGHAIVLNSAALAAVGISNVTDEPPGCTIDRDTLTGEPTGLLLEMEDFVRARVPGPTVEELRTSMRLASNSFLSNGILSVCDTSPGNSVETYDTFKEMQSGGYFLPALTMMIGPSHLDDFVENALPMKLGTGMRNIGHVKIMLTMSGGTLSPSQSELTSLISKAHSLEYPVAIHTVEAAALEAALNSLEDATPLPNRYWRDRIEHCSECPPELISKMARLNVAVVTNPAFLYHSGDRYLAETEGSKIPWLYRAKSLVESGIRVAAGSDAPVTDPNPIIGIYSAITRRSIGGKQINAEEGLNLKQALTMHSRRVVAKDQDNYRSDQYRRGHLTGNLILLDRQLNEDDPEEILKTRVAMTILNGKIVYEG
ncbi:MAG: hypothetical protein BZY79_04505 [SAR202 cluster bacterium Casp-Chloro-G4]|nr:amidohydrolase family protein [Chloroflexota bacterium]MDA1227620.1 amidohydrolase family protein [Chloroflexota bacterium]PKB61287.1 MAG: hypothetical protein BZY79_04505 [SAR202 cluster bacterium Casp-Chloro-G4]